jgi:hypothetical protein
MTGGRVWVSYDLTLGLLRREPVEVLPRCVYSVLNFFEGDHSSGSIFSSSSSLPSCCGRVIDPVCGSKWGSEVVMKCRTVK